MPALITFVCGGKRVEHALEPFHLHVQRVWRYVGEVKPHLLEELPPQRRRSTHREVRPMPEVLRRRRLPPAEERRQEWQLQPLRCIHSWRASVCEIERNSTIPSVP